MKKDIDVIGWAVGILILLFILGGMAAIFKSASADGKIDYCYTSVISPTDMAPQYRLHGHRPWREDRSLGIYPTLNDAALAAQKYQCELH
jgi:hypothetical protein